MTTAKSSRGTRTKASTRKASSRATKAAARATSQDETSDEVTGPAPKKPVKRTPPPPLPEGVEDPVSEGVRELVELFQGPLQTVSFPDVDREVLEERCDALRDADGDVRRLFAELEAAQVKLAAERDALEKCAERGLAYARVFAGDDEELVEKLGNISVGTAKKGVRKQKARVPKAAKAKTDSTEPESSESDSEKPEGPPSLPADDLVENELVIEDETKLTA